MLATILAAAAMAQQQPATSDVLNRGRQVQQRPAPELVKQQQPDGTVAVLASGVERPIQGIAFEGAEAPAPVAAAAEKFIGRLATKETLIELASALARAYENSNVALYTVAIPEQEFDNDVVLVLLAEGSVEAVQVQTEGGETFPLLSRQAARLVGEKPLSRTVYERQLSLMRAIPGLTFDAAFENPDDDDSVTLRLKPNQQTSEITFSVSNRGPDLAGDVIGEGRADLFRVVTDGDKLTFAASATPNLRSYQQLGASYALPIGADGLTFSASGIWLRTRPRELNIEGTAKLASATLSYPVLRRFHSAADVNLGVDGIDSSNAALGNVIVSEKTRAARLAGSFVSASERHNFSATATLSQGLDILGAMVIAPASEADFRKANASASYNRNFTAKLIGRASVTGQYTEDRLPAVELFAVGGPTIGRAFDTGFLTGDLGAGGFLEAAYLPISEQNFGRSELYIFTDAATLKVNRRGDLPRQNFDMASAGAGVRIRWRDKVELNLEAARVINRPFAGYSGDWRLSFYYSLTL